MQLCSIASLLLLCAAATVAADNQFAVPATSASASVLDTDTGSAVKSSAFQQDAAPSFGQPEPVPAASEEPQPTAEDIQEAVDAIVAIADQSSAISEETEAVLVAVIEAPDVKSTQDIIPVSLEKIIQDADIGETGTDQTAETAVAEAEPKKANFLRRIRTSPELRGAAKKGKKAAKVAGDVALQSADSSLRFASQHQAKFLQVVDYVIQALFIALDTTGMESSELESIQIALSAAVRQAVTMTFLKLENNGGLINALDSAKEMDTAKLIVGALKVVAKSALVGGKEAFNAKRIETQKQADAAKKLAAPSTAGPNMFAKLPSNQAANGQRDARARRSV